MNCGASSVAPNADVPQTAVEDSWPSLAYLTDGNSGCAGTLISLGSYLIVTSYTCAKAWSDAGTLPVVYLGVYALNNPKYIFKANFVYLSVCCTGLAT